jgi:hypothetical protein
MALYKTRGVVIGRRAFGESDRLVDFYTRDHGKVRGIARSARRPRSRFGSALELFTLGEMVFFDSGRSELVQVDHFDIVRPFVGVREHLDRLGQGAWVVEVVAIRSLPCSGCWCARSRPWRRASGPRGSRSASGCARWTCSVTGPGSIAAWPAAGRILSTTRRST